MRRKLTQILALVAVLCLATGAGLWATGTAESGTPATAAGTPKKGGTLNVALHIPFATLDWQATVQHPAPQVQSNVWEGLTAFGKDFTAVPELAESYQASADGLVWTFNLRKGVLFHNLKEMTSADVKASVERWKKVGPKGAGLPLDKIETPDKYTVQMYFKTPMGQTLLLQLGSDENKCVIMPKEVCDASPNANALSAIIGTGPYKWTEYKEDQFIKLTRFEQYAQRTDAPNFQSGRKVPYLDQIIFWIVPETSTRIAGLESGEYDVAVLIPDSEYDKLSKTKGVVPVIVGPGFNFYIMFNHQKGLTSNLNIRKAIQAALNCEELMAAAVPEREIPLPRSQLLPSRERVQQQGPRRALQPEQPRQGQGIPREGRVQGGADHLPGDLDEARQREDRRGGRGAAQESRHECLCPQL